MTVVARTLLAAVLAGAASALLAAPATAQEQDPQEAFLEDFDRALKFNDLEAMATALRRHKEAAIHVFLDRAVRRVTEGSAELDVWVDGFRRAWTDTFRNDFARNYDRYLQFLDGDVMQMRSLLIRRDFPELNQLHLAAVVEQSDEADWDTLRRLAGEMAESFDKVGDLYYLALTENIRGNAWNPAIHEEGSDAEKSLAAYDACIAARDKLDLTNDRFYANVKAYSRDLRAELGLADPDDPEGKVPERKPVKGELLPAEDAEMSTAPLEDEVFRIGELEHACDLADAHHFTWKRTGAGKVGESISLPAIQPPVRLVREAVNRFVLEAGDEPSEEFRLAARPVEVTVRRKHADGSVRPYTLQLASGSTSSSIHGVTLNLAPSEYGAPVFFRSVSARVAETSFGDLTVYDLNSDGAFGYEEMGLDWSEGLTPDTFFYRPDGVALGRMKQSQPYSPWLRDRKGQWFSVRFDDPLQPTEVTVQPVSGVMGTLEVDYPGIRRLDLVSLLLVSQSSATEGLVVDLAAWKGDEHQLPVGRYHFVQARFAGDDGEEILVLPPVGRPIPVDVSEEEPAVLELGEPFRLETKVSRDGPVLTVSGRELHVAGRADERYMHVIGEPLFGVEVEVAGESQELKRPSTEEANEDWERLYFPMDASFQLEDPDEEVTVTLELKKHPWFGKLSSEVKP